MEGDFKIQTLVNITLDVEKLEIFFEDLKEEISALKSNMLKKETIDILKQLNQIVKKYK